MYRIISQEKDFLVVNKQGGIGVHNTQDSQGLISRLREDLNSESIFPVHRLDKDTSGLLLCATSRSACSELSQLFASKSVEKYYLALSDKKPKKKQGLVVGDLEKTRNGSWKLSKNYHNPSVTQFFSYGSNEGKRLFLLKPYTGKTHQLRVVLKSLGSPILGDKRYGFSNDNLENMHLHAYVLSFFLNHQHWYFQSFPETGLFDRTLLDLIKEKWHTPETLDWPKIPTRYA